jgi:hypothetical protein
VGTEDKIFTRLAMNYTTRSDKITTYRYKNYYIDTTNKIITIIK